MTFTIGHVEGGTNAGCRRVRQPHARWFCNCETGDGLKLNPGYLGRCQDCETTRSRPVVGG